MSSAIPDLTGWLDDPATERGIRFADRGGDWDFWSYPRLADRTHRVAGGLVAAGLRRNDVVAIVQTSGPDFVTALFGVLAAGGTPTPVAPPMTFQDPDAYATHVAALLAAARPALVVCEPRLVARVGPLAAAAGVVRVVTVDELAASPWLATQPSAALALLQFTSGSSGTAAGARISRSALSANLAAITDWLGIRPQDPTASWLPVHHDMGLIGCLLTPVVNGTDIWLLSPEDFVRGPARYLRCFGLLGARLTAMPSFGLAHIAHRVDPTDLVGCDFAQWRAIIVGAERIDPHVLNRVHELLAPFGLDRRAYLPAYGLAEATLAVTGLPLADQWRETAIDPAAVVPGTPVRDPASAERSARMVGCGYPVRGVSVTIVDDQGQDLPDDHVGEIAVRGASVADGYVAHHQPARVSRFDTGTLYTGDAGFLRDGQLYVLGRLGDSIKIRGRTVFAEDLDASLGSLGASSRRLVTVLGDRAGQPTVLVIMEQPHPRWAEHAVELLTPRTEGAAVYPIVVPRGTITWTSSGKPRRRALWTAFLDGRLDPAAPPLAAAAACSTATTTTTP